jgi:hypothetical protein
MSRRQILVTAAKGDRNLSYLASGRTSDEKEVAVRRVVLLTALVAVAAAPSSAAREPVRTFPDQKVAAGFYKDRALRYLDLGPVKLARGNKVAPIWAFTNGAEGQRNVVDVAPGDRGYTPLWRVVMVTWSEGASARVLRSAADIRRAARAGEVSLEQTATVVNCPVLGFGQKRTLGFAKGERVAYLDLGPVKLARGNKVAPIWAFTNGAEGQRNVIDVVPGQRGYTPLWRVNMVTWANGASPRVLESAREIRRARAAGELTIRRAATVVNCPVL